MAWDASRPVPWQRLVKEWCIYVGIMAVVFALFFRDQGLLGIMAGLLISGPLYLAIGFVLAKLGYQRRSLREMSGATAADTSGSDDHVETPRPRPAPTKRTGGGRPKRPAKRRR